MKILYVPLDERPCNLRYPQQIAQLQDHLTLTVPPIEILGQKKRPADVEKLWHWIESEIELCAVAILSIEMLVYGGLLPSRLHHHPVEVLSDRIFRLRQLKTQYPHVRLLASTLIMRTPSYNSSEEEPGYYADWGNALFRWGWYADKRQRGGLSEAEAAELEQLSQDVPPTVLKDYQSRRAKNLTVNQGAIALVREGVIEFLSIPQDDAALYGFTALDQKAVVATLLQHRLQSRVHLYPGADEVGCTLLARAYTQFAPPSTPCPSSNESSPSLVSPQSTPSAPAASPPTPTPWTPDPRPKIFVLYSSVCSETIVPLYEDRPLGESVKAHILAAGGQMVFTPNGADLVLAVNTPGQRMQEAWDQGIKDVTYSSYRNLRVFVDQIRQAVRAGQKVAIADVAFANGGETELVQLLDEAQVWDHVVAYAGWNTCCNTVGSAIATALVGLRGANPRAIQQNTIYHLLEGWAYQSIVRTDMVNRYLPTLGASYYDFQGHEATIAQKTADRMQQAWAAFLRHSFQSEPLATLEIYFPWHRMFEVGLRLTFEPDSTATSI